MGATPARWPRVALALVVANAAWVVLERRGRPAWRTETERVVASGEGPYRGAELHLPRRGAPRHVLVATYAALLGASATLPWLPIGMTELLGPRSPLVLATSLVFVATGCWSVRACAAALAAARPHAPVVSWLCPAAVLGFATSAACGAFDAVEVLVHGIKGYTQLEPLGRVLSSDSLFTSCNGHAGPVWHAMIVLAIASAMLLLAAVALPCYPRRARLQPAAPAPSTTARSRASSGPISDWRSL